MSQNHDNYGNPYSSTNYGYPYGGYPNTASGSAEGSSTGSGHHQGQQGFTSPGVYSYGQVSGGYNLGQPVQNAIQPAPAGASAYNHDPQGYNPQAYMGQAYPGGQAYSTQQFSNAQYHNSEASYNQNQERVSWSEAFGWTDDHDSKVNHMLWKATLEMAKEEMTTAAEHGRDTSKYSKRAWTEEHENELMRLVGDGGYRNVSAQLNAKFPDGPQRTEGACEHRYRELTGPGGRYKRKR